MDKERFLRAEHARILASREFMASEWRDSVDRFVADLWNMTPLNRCGRYLAPKDKTLGFSRDNVEYAFEPPVRRAAAKKSQGKKVIAKKPPRAKAKAERPTVDERRAAENAARLERRHKLAMEIQAWKKQPRHPKVGNCREVSDGS